MEHPTIAVMAESGRRVSDKAQIERELNILRASPHFLRAISRIFPLQW